MKKIKKIIVISVSCFLLMGCNITNGGDNEGDLSNINISKINRQIDMPEKIYKMRGKKHGSWNDDKLYGRFPVIVEAYGGNPNDSDKLYIETWIEGEQENIPINKYDDETIWSIKYCSPDLYIDMTQIMQLMIYNPQEVVRVLGEEVNINKVWIPAEHADPIKTYKIGIDNITDISYCLDGELVSLEDSIKFVETEMTNNKRLPLISKEGFEYRVSEISVYKFNENHCYYFTLNLYYNNVKLDDQHGFSNENNSNNKEMVFAQTMDRCSMISKNRINGYYTFDWLNEKQDEIEEINIEIDYQEALKILSNHLSSNHVFDVLNAELVYNFYIETDEGTDGFENGVNYISPHWQFELSTEGMQQYNNIYILIDLQTGEVIERYA